MAQETPTCASAAACLPGVPCVAIAGLDGNPQGICVDETQADLRAGRVVLTNPGYAATPAFFRHHAAGRYPRSLVNQGACRTLYSGSLAATFLGLGAATVRGPRAT